MGNRVSIAFVGERGEQSPVLFSHWQGMDLVETAQAYVQDLPEQGSYDPLSRREPQTMLVDFISRVVGAGEKIESDLYLVENEYDGDNSDNGHFTICSVKGELLDEVQINNRQEFANIKND